MKTILASASPRRQELLKLLFDEFEIHPSRIEETVPEDIGPEFTPVILSAMKAEDISRRHPGDLVIAADTVVLIEGKILGKPKSAEEAAAMLRSLSGKTHKVITGCCMQIDEKASAFADEALVTFYDLTEEEIREYVRTGEPMDKAGAYGIQGKGALLVKGIQGDFYNVMGLPVARLKRELNDFLSAPDNGTENV